MNTKSELKKQGIKIINRIDPLVVNSIAKNVARRIVESFPELNLSENDIFSKIAKLDMYKAQIPYGMAEASYFYKTQSIYFNEKIDYEDLEEFAIHECIHHLQEIIDGNGNLVYMGLSDYTTGNPIGVGINEAAVQYTSSFVIGIEAEYEKYYNITMLTPSPSYYPLECALLNELIHFTGKDALFKSTLFSNDSFENKILTFIPADVYLEIMNKFDSLLNLEENLAKINIKIDNLRDGSSKFKKLEQKINIQKEKITNMFLDIQNYIITQFFDRKFSSISNLQELEDFRHSLEEFSKIVATSDNYSFFDNYYKEMMNKLEHKCTILENGGIETALCDVSQNRFQKIWKKLLKFFEKRNHNENIN